MTSCPHCTASLPANGYTFCPSCGRPFDPRDAVVRETSCPPSPPDPNPSPQVPADAVPAVFCPPSVGYRVVPIPIAGRGWCRITAEGIEFSAFHQRRSGCRTAVLLLLAMLLIGSIVAVVKHYFPDVPARLVATLPAIIVCYFLLGGVPSHDPNRPFAFTVPWRCLRSAAADRWPRQVAVVLHVVGMQPTGTVHFAPRGGSQAFLAALSRRS